MTVWIDPPRWPAHGRHWSHLISDASYDELHAFASAHGIPRRAFEGDHYDVPDDMYAALVAGGATPVEGRDLIRVLRDSGLRLPKRRGEKGIARVTNVSFADGTMADVDLIASSSIAPDARVFASMAFVEDASGRFAVVFSPRRSEWGSPGGWREHGEGVVEAAVREVFEETGLRIEPKALVPVGYERFHPHTADGPWRAGHNILQVFRTRVEAEAPPLQGDGPDVVERRWVTGEEFRGLCGERFWWPMAERVLSRRGA